MGSTDQGAGERHAVATGAGRLHALDSLRGVAVLTMVVDHVLVATDGSGWSIGRLLTRVSLALFAVVLGACATWPLGWRRCLPWAGALGAALVLYPLAGLGGPLLLAWLAAARWFCVRSPRWLLWVTVVLVLTMATNGVALPRAAGEYPALGITAMAAVGRLAGLGNVDRFGRKLRLPAWVAAVGRRPLAWYVGHLLVLAALGVAS